MTPRDRWILGGILLAGALLRFLTLGHQSYDHDEAVTASRVLEHSFGATMHAVAHGERSPPLYYILAWLWSKLFGTGEVGLRSLSALVGTLTIPIAYRAVRVFASKRAALIAAALVAFNPYLIWYSQEARSYPLLIFFGAIALVYFGESIRNPTPRSLGLWAAASALSVCSHYFAVFLIAPQALWLLARRPRARSTIAAVAAVGAVGLALAPYALHQEGSGRRNGFTSTSLAVRAGETGLNFVASEEPAPLAGSTPVDALQVGAGVGAALLAVVALTLIARSRVEDERLGAVAFGSVGLASLAVPFALAVVGVDFIDPRNLIGSLVPLLLVAAIGFGATAAGRRGLLAGALGVVMFAGVDAAVWSSPQMQRPDWRGAASAIGQTSRTRILVVPHNGDDPLIYYLGAAKAKPAIEPPGGVRDLLVLSSGTTRPPRHGFHLVRQQGLTRPFALQEYRARRGVVLKPERFAQYVLNQRASALIQAPR